LALWGGRGDQNAGLSGKIVVVGFDANPDEAAAILAADDASVAQAP